MSDSEKLALDEQREHNRLPRPYPIELKELAFSNNVEVIVAECTDISAGGICIEIDTHLPVGAKMQIRVNIPLLNKHSSSFMKIYENDAEQYFTAITEVLWHRKVNDRHQVGMCFVNADETQLNALKSLINKAVQINPDE